MSTEEADIGEPTPIPLLIPAEGVPAVSVRPEEIAEAAARIAAGEGPIAIDTERASGFRYSQRPYLIQIRRAGAGTFLIDPIPHPDSLGPLIAALTGPEWVLHSAGGDLPSLAEIGIRASSLFDTELAGRLAGFERVGLAAIVEKVLGLGLVKGHGAADWSARPLPAEWLNYAALDVEVLLALREALAADLEAQGKAEWAAEEFAHVLAGGSEPVDFGAQPERWRRTSAIHTLRGRRPLAAVRELWRARDEIARTTDIAPGRVLPDKSIVEAVKANPTSIAELVALPVFGGRSQRRRAEVWLAALRRAAAMPESQLPPLHAPSDGPPHPSRWRDRDPAAADRLERARAAIGELAAAHRIPAENLLVPDALRRLCWRPPAPLNAASVSAALVGVGSRNWQSQLTAAPLAAALASPPTETPIEPPASESYPPVQPID